VKKIKPVKLWTWAIQNEKGDYELCYFTFHTKKMLKQETKPSPEAKPVRVLLSVLNKKSARRK